MKLNDYTYRKQKVYECFKRFIMIYFLCSSLFTASRDINDITLVKAD